MNGFKMEGLAPGGLRSARRKAVSVSGETLVTFGRLSGGGALPLVVRPAVEDVALVSWVRDNLDLVHAPLADVGGILFRGFQRLSIPDFEALVQEVAGELLEYTYRSTPRREVAGRVYSSTEYPAEESIPMHNEMSYTRSWPLKIGFFSVEVAARQGETPIADSRRVYEAIPEAVRKKFEEKGVLYVRNYRPGLDVSWQEVFQTEDRDAAEEFCRARDIELEWLSGGRLRTRQVCQAVAVHPRTGETVWFNQAHLFHVSSLRPEVRKFLLDELGEEELPRNTYYGDGSPIEEEALDQIRRAFEEVSVVFPWQEKDVLLLDNMLVAHGRRPYEGKRKVVVAMGEPWGAEAAR